MVTLNIRMIVMHILKFSHEIISFPFFRVEKTKGDTVFAWRVWHVVAYLYFWWNFS